jgi:hypothetical protein
MFAITRRQLAAVTSIALVGAALALAAAAWAKSPIVHKVSAGGPDACIALGAAHPGCNGNYSLVAKQFADGSVSGQYTDQFGHGNGGFHAVIDCLSVVGNTAWIGGVVTSGTFGLGQRVVTEIQDNGTSAKDPPDRISYSYLSNISCTTHFNGAPLYVTQGQVKVS